MNEQLPWIVLGAPLASAALILAFARRSAALSAALSVGASLVALAGAILLFAGPEMAASVPWLSAGGGLELSVGYRIDGLSKTMLVVVTAIGALVHVYSLGYMAEDRSRARYFGGLSMFMFSMLGIVLADNFVMMFIFWELVGLSSYLLIGHWFTKPSAADAAKKAFIVNRIGDFGFLLGILTLWAATGAVGFAALEGKVGALAGSGFLTAAVLLVFCGTVGKSAQFPLHVWLPDAMEGPTPVSALIHAATMVAAGVYMMARVIFLVSAAPDAGTVIAWVGGITSLMAALIATQQNDIKRILAYSTLSQLGYMVMAIGLAADVAAMFHLFTHAFFKALLFLGAGSVIHALHHEQDIWNMGGLAKRMPVTFWTFAVGTLALTGCPGLAGFFSKDMILLAAHGKSGALFAIGLATAFLTAYYMVRLVVVAFLGKARGEAAGHGHESPTVMTAPLVLLAVASVIAGYGFVAERFFRFDHGAHHGMLVPLLAGGAFVAGSALAFFLYRGRAKDPVLVPAFANKFYFDEIYAGLVRWTHDLVATASAFIDRWVVDGLFVQGTARLVYGFGFALRLFQMGNLQAYAFLFGAGSVALIYFVVFR
jgi:NADH-quinone oxidoreductase subunit L